MREIKFQAFVERGIIEGYPAAIYPVENICWRNGKIIAVNLLPCEWIDIKWVTLREYTGLKDKDGEEIYEGDIIQWWNGKEFISGPQVVRNTSGGWNPFIDDCQTDDSWHYGIVGNIYENPELLKKE